MLHFSFCYRSPSLCLHIVVIVCIVFVLCVPVYLCVHLHVNVWCTKKVLTFSLLCKKLIKQNNILQFLLLKSIETKIKTKIISNLSNLLHVWECFNKLSLPSNKMEALQVIIKRLYSHHMYGITKNIIFNIFKQYFN